MPTAGLRPVVQVTRLYSEAGFDVLRGYDGAFIHQLRTRPQDKAPHPRIIAIRRDLAVGYGRDKRLGGRYKGIFPTITSKFLQSQRQFSNYKWRQCDEAPKGRTYLPRSENLAHGQGLARDTQFSHARRCATECPG